MLHAACPQARHVGVLAVQCQIEPLIVARDSQASGGRRFPALGLQSVEGVDRGEALPAGGVEFAVDDRGRRTGGERDFGTGRIRAERRVREDGENAEDGGKNESCVHSADLDCQ